MKVGIIGFPNVGKSTLFNALTKMNILEANYPFATIKPNIGIVDIPDERLNYLAKIFGSQKITTAQIKFIDVAGLIKGASKGEGLGNQFLGHIRNVDTICHVVKCFKDPNIIHLNSEINPIEESQIIETELILSDLEQIEQRLLKIKKNNKVNKEHLQETKLLIKIRDYLQKEIPINQIGLTSQELQIVKHFNLLSIKPMIYIGNFLETDLNDLENNIFFQKMKIYSQKKEKYFFPTCILLEKKMSHLDLNTKNTLLKGYNYNLQNRVLHEIIKQSYHTLGLKTYFTTGKDETKAWSFVEGTKAPQCAKLIHTDFQRGFIKIEVFNFKDIINFPSLAKIKENGKLRLEGKEYLVQDGDVIHFYFNV
ncbi:redox-regulated ATPase YchF [Candidatus Phytoplasma melaleucae]|uniref:Ribosome-binding ATPase YchF n=1 Tax=Candidatus Phytoplasma melaleucae TaxID=2982630 RepID=A0ABT9DD27_9MOLU|nr:redox-regulated ATPase YchF ['Melaleuca sp.' phytoplasma]MDO8167987.1 redox-regulated ATPase YchF ['Melaleuca sp.' phytoplasma]